MVALTNDSLVVLACDLHDRGFGIYRKGTLTFLDSNDIDFCSKPPWSMPSLNSCTPSRMAMAVSEDFSSPCIW